MTAAAQGTRFTTAPGADFVAAFREHVRLTAAPETFPGIRQNGFPSDGNVEILFRPISVSRKARGGSGVPCPICSTKAGKWLSGGTLLWCEAAEAVFVIGPDCYATLDGGDRIARAINAFNVVEQERRAAQRLADIASLSGDLIAWASKSRAQAAAVSAAQVGFAKSLPRVRKGIHNVLKSGSIVTSAWLEDGRVRQEAVGRLDGAGFLTGRWALPQQMDDAASTLRRLVADAGADPISWAASLAPAVRRDRLAEARKAVADLVKSRDRMNQAAAFLSQDNVQVLARWSAKGAPVEFRAAHSATKLTLSAGDQAWEGPVGIANSPALPEAVGALWG